MADEDDGFDIPIRATGGQAAAREIGKPTESLKRYITVAKQANREEKQREQGLRRLAREQENMARSAERAAQTMHQAQIKQVAALGMLTNQLGKINSGFGEMASSISGAAVAMRSMTALIGGPWGIALGAAVGLMQLFTDSTDRAAKKTAALSSELRNVPQVTLPGVDREAAAQARQKQVTRLRWLQERGAALTPEETQMLQDQYLHMMEDTIGPDVSDAGPTARGGYGRDRDRSLTRQEQIIMDMGRTGPAFGAPIDVPDEWEEIAGPNALFGERDVGGRGLDDFLSGAAARGGSELAGMSDEAIRNAELVARAWQGAASSIEETMLDAFSAITSGSAEATKAALIGIGNEAKAEGARDILRGGIMLATGMPNGAAVMAGGAGLVALGTALGATAGVVPGGGGGAAARPTPRAREGHGSGGDGMRIINVNAMNPTTRIGETIALSEERYRRKHGGG